MDANECVASDAEKRALGGRISTPRVLLLHIRNLYVFFYGFLYF